MSGKEDFIRNFEGIIIGIVETNDIGDQIVRSFPARQILGFYRKSRDVTTDFYGRIISKGNTCVSLIFTQKK